MKDYQSTNNQILEEMKQEMINRMVTDNMPESKLQDILDVFAEKELADTQVLVLDFADLEYISSAGLRVLLKLQKVMNKKGSMKLIHVGDIVKEVFEITGFTDILTIE